MSSTDGWLGYSFPRISHQRGSISSTSTNSYVIDLSKHVGAYNQFMITTVNTHASNSIDVQIQYSEDGETWFIDQGYTTAVAVAGGATPEAFDSWASEVEHHFYRIKVKSTSSGKFANERAKWQIPISRPIFIAAISFSVKGFILIGLCTVTALFCPISPPLRTRMVTDSVST